jgi:Leucine-rich repeat (LRR) protein
MVKRNLDTRKRWKQRLLELFLRLPGQGQGQGQKQARTRERPLLAPMQEAAEDLPVQILAAVQYCVLCKQPVDPTPSGSNKAASPAPAPAPAPAHFHCLNAMQTYQEQLAKHNRILHKLKVLVYACLSEQEREKLAANAAAIGSDILEEVEQSYVREISNEYALLNNEYEGAASCVHYLRSLATGHIIGLQFAVIYCTTLPEDLLIELDELEILDIVYHSLTALPASIFACSRLRILKIRLKIRRKLKEQEQEQLVALPENLGQLAQLEVLEVSDNCLSSLPESLGSLQQLRKLNVRNNKLRTLPASVGQLQQLRYLAASENCLLALPESLGHLPLLSQLQLEHNQLSSLPNNLGLLHELKILDLAWNQLSSLPDNLGLLHELEYLDLAGNQLSSLPDSFRGLQNLQYLGLGCNRNLVLPAWLADLKKLQRVSVCQVQRQTAGLSDKPLILPTRIIISISESCRCGQR